jgi:hypothetical protein
MHPLRLRYSAKLFCTHMLAVFLVSGSVGTFSMRGRWTI